MTVKCDYCGEDAELVGGDVIYPHRKDLAHKKFWRCAPCKAYVGCHAPNQKFGYDGTQPLGRLANSELRRAKSRAHDAFDPMWRTTMRKERVPKKVARDAAYGWLARKLGIQREACHIGMFDVETCNRVVKICRSNKSIVLKYEIQREARA